MRSYRKVGGGQGRTRVLRSATAAVLLACLFLALPMFGGTAWAIDLTQANSLTVAPGPSEWAEDLAKANVVVDLYLVAGARAVDGYDTYSYTFLAPYTEALGEGDAVSLDYDANLDAAGWRELAEQVAELALEKGSPIVTGASVNDKITSSDSGDALGAGLYLLIARGKELEEYSKNAKSQSADADSDSEETTLVTLAYSPEYEYSFLPELISLPSKEAVTDEESGVTIINTANPGEWIYDLSVVLKPERDLRFGSLEIVKTLSDRIGPDPAMFVFHWYAYDAEDNLLKDDVVTLSFVAGGEKSTIVDRIPVGARVVVHEEERGNYVLVSANDPSAVISADELAQVSFTNQPSDEPYSGFGIANHFEYKEYDNGTPDEWTWEPLADSN